MVLMSSNEIADIIFKVMIKMGLAMFLNKLNHLNEKNISLQVTRVPLLFKLLVLK